MVKNAEGLVALEHYNTNPSPPVTVDDRTYQANPQYNVSLMWVKEEDVERILNSPQNMVKGCDCGNGAMKPRFHIASEINVSIHLTGDRPH